MKRFKPGGNRGMLGAIMTLSVVGMLNYMGQSGESCHTYFNERQLDAKPKYEELDSSLTSNRDCERVGRLS